MPNFLCLTRIAANCALHLTAAVSIGIVCGSAQASFVEADLPSSDAQAELGTHIVIGGRGLEAGKTWFMAAHTQALVFRDRARHGNITLLAALDPLKESEYLETLRTWGYRNIRVYDVDFTAKELIDRLSEPKLIASLDFIGHDGAFLGLALEDEGSNHRFYKSDAKALAARAHFSKDSFIRLLGCNTGWFLAPYMAKVLGVPTRGTLTSADVQLLYGSSATPTSWYFDENGQQPRGASSIKKNSISYVAETACVKGGGCVRLKPINGSYIGQHGTYAGALPFGKFFCGTVSEKDCFRRMALATEYAVSVSPMKLASKDAEIANFDSFAEVLADDFCPAQVDSVKAKMCHDGIVGHLKGTSVLPRDFTTLPKRNPQLACDFNGCLFHVGADDKGQKILLSDARAASTTFVDELNAYREGYDALKN